MYQPNAPFTEQQINFCLLKSFSRTKATSRIIRKKIHTYFPGTCPSQLLKQENKMCSKKLEEYNQNSKVLFPPTQANRYSRITVKAPHHERWTECYWGKRGFLFQEHYLATPLFGLHLVPIQSTIRENWKSRKYSVDTETTCLGSIPNVHNSDRCFLQPAKASPVKHCRSPLLPTPCCLRGGRLGAPSFLGQCNPTGPGVLEAGLTAALPLGWEGTSEFTRVSARGDGPGGRWGAAGAPPPPDKYQGPAWRAQGPLAPAPTTPAEAHGERRGALQAHPPTPLGGLASRLGRGAPRCCGSRGGREPPAGPVVGRGARRRGRGGDGRDSGGAGRRRDGVTCAPGRRVPHSRGGSSTQQHKMAGAPPRSVTWGWGHAPQAPPRDPDEAAALAARPPCDVMSEGASLQRPLPDARARCSATSPPSPRSPEGRWREMAGPGDTRASRPARTLW